MDFRHFNDPEKAARVYEEYAQEINGLGGGDQAYSAVYISKTSDELDVRLDLIVSALERDLAGKQVGTPVDEDIGSYRTIAVRALEERQD